jgi:hypothetical protein
MMHHLQVGAESSWLAQAGAATLLYAHIGGGLVAIGSGATALAFRKGSRRHALAGNVFFASMMVMTLVGGFVAPFLVSRQGEPKLGDSIAGFFTLYLVLTSWLTVRRKAGAIGRAEPAAFVFAASLAAIAVLIGTKASGSAGGQFGGFAASGYYALAGIIALAAALDAKVIRNRGIAGAPRIARHLWRMCLALFVATGSFFLGQQRVMPEAVRGSPILLVLGLAPLVFMLFWLVRVRFGKRLRAALEALGGHRGVAPAGGMKA